MSIQNIVSLNPNCVIFTNTSCGCCRGGGGGALEEDVPGHQEPCDG